MSDSCHRIHCNDSNVVSVHNSLDKGTPIVKVEREEFFSPSSVFLFPKKSLICVVDVCGRGSVI